MQSQKDEMILLNQVMILINQVMILMNQAMAKALGVSYEPLRLDISTGMYHFFKLVQ
jgi:hypothetical protein